MQQGNNIPDISMISISHRQFRIQRKWSLISDCNVETKYTFLTWKGILVEGSASFQANPSLPSQAPYRLDYDVQLRIDMLIIISKIEMFFLYHISKLKQDFVGVPSDPWKPNTRYGVRQNISNNCWVAISRWKVCMKLRRMPMSNSGHDDTFNVTHYILEKW